MEEGAEGSMEEWTEEEVEGREGWKKVGKRSRIEERRKLFEKP